MPYDHLYPEHFDHETECGNCGAIFDKRRIECPECGEEINLPDPDYYWSDRK